MTYHKIRVLYFRDWQLMNWKVILPKFPVSLPHTALRVSSDLLATSSGFPIMIKLTSLCLFAVLTISSSKRSTAEDASLPSDPNWNWDEIYDEHKSEGEDWNDWYARRYGEQPWWWDVSSDDSDVRTARQGLKPSLPSVPGSRPPAPKGFEIPPLSDIAALYRDQGYAFSSARQMEHEPRMSHQVAQRAVSGRLAGLAYARQQTLRSTANKQAKHLPHH
ncbi:hypothetical protein RvY_06910 [Ramazzottius varieornatus]|uniref:Uncharacterized protein n=1 Tax=Ramazzottius varieornatus TaxID=947166 RepID=A0A1D1V071_RAMVA|nr:hypothetical protein RvY_06910 [Ramazzottius varieornatus]